MNCIDCDGPLVKNGRLRPGVWYEILGFEQPRAQGGTNAIGDRRRTGRMLCFACMQKRKSGVSPSQQQLGAAR